MQDISTLCAMVPPVPPSPENGIGNFPYDSGIQQQDSASIGKRAANRRANDVRYRAVTDTGD
jgi:hypothetical protein